MSERAVRCRAPDRRGADRAGQRCPAPATADRRAAARSRQPRRRSILVRALPDQALTPAALVPSPHKTRKGGRRGKRSLCASFREWMHRSSRLKRAIPADAHRLCSDLQPETAPRGFVRCWDIRASSEAGCSCQRPCGRRCGCRSISTIPTGSRTRSFEHHVRHVALPSRATGANCHPCRADLCPPARSQPPAVGIHHHRRIDNVPGVTPGSYAMVTKVPTPRSTG